MNAGGKRSEASKKVWKELSSNETMDKMKENLHADPGYKEWQDIVNREIKDIINNQNIKSYEEIFTELGGHEISSENDDLEDLMKQVVAGKMSTLPQEVKDKIFKNWRETIKELTPKKSLPSSKINSKRYKSVSEIKKIIFTT